MAGAANDKVLLLAQIARLLLDPGLPDEERLGALFDAVPKDRLAAALADCERIARPACNSHVDLLGDHYSRLRQCMPRFLEVLTFCSHRHDDELLEGIDVLKGCRQGKPRTRHGSTTSPDAVTDGGGGADMRRASNRLIWADIHF